MNKVNQEILVMGKASGNLKMRQYGKYKNPKKHFDQKMFLKKLFFLRFLSRDENPLATQGQKVSAGPVSVVQGRHAEIGYRFYCLKSTNWMLVEAFAPLKDHQISAADGQLFWRQTPKRI